MHILISSLTFLIITFCSFPNHIQASPSGLQNSVTDPWIISAYQVGPVTTDSTEEQLSAQLGTAVQTGLTTNFQTPITRIYPGTPKELEVTWSDNRRIHPISVAITQPNSPWHTAQGIHTGTLLPELLSINKQPIYFQGFSAPSGASASWQGGTLAASGLVVYCAFITEVPPAFSRPYKDYSSTELIPFLSQIQVTRITQQLRKKISPTAKINAPNLNDAWLISSSKIGPVTAASTEALLLSQPELQCRSEWRRGAEGQGKYPVTLVYPGTAMEMEVWWTDATRTHPRSVTIRNPESPWHTNEGLRCGMPLDELTAINGIPVQFLGFGWDYSGWASWQGGFLSATGLQVQLKPLDRGLTILNSDKTFHSDDLPVSLSEIVIATIIQDIQAANP